jgi:hypothetical protein
MARKSRKTEEIRVRASALDVTRLQALARLEETSAAAVLRRLIAEEYRRKGLDSNA